MGASSKDKGTHGNLRWQSFRENFEGKFSRVPRWCHVWWRNAENAEESRADVVEILSGDIITPKDFPFTIEAKHYDDFKFSHLLHEKKIIRCGLESAEKDANLAKRLPMIMAKFSYIGSYVYLITK